MKVFRTSFIFLLAVISNGIHAQQFDGILRNVGYPGLSDGCLNALNTTVASCPSFLSSISVEYPRLNADRLATLCTSSCRSALVNIRSTIKTGCSAANDTIDIDAVVYPATFIIDRFLYTYDLSCRKDSSSGRYCDELMFSWLAAGNASTKAANCSDCSLGSMQTQLNSPFGFDEEFAQQFQAAKSSCGSSGYSFTTPTPYAVSTRLPDRAEDANTPSCSNPYVVKSGDTCDAIALSLQVSTFSIIKAGGLKNGCTNLIPGATLCLPAPCNLYRVQPGDDCKNIVNGHGGITGISFLSWNPNITPLCSNLADLTSSLICVSPPGGNNSDITITVTPPTTTTIESTAVPKPTNGKGDTTAPCASWYTIQDGDYCDSVSIRQNIALQDFYFLNPSIDSKCLNLWLNTAYCVQAVGDINTYPGYPYSSSAVYTLTKPTYVTTTAVLTPLMPTATNIAALPRAPGTKSDCEVYVDYLPVEPFQDQSEAENVRLVTEEMNSCDFASSAYPVPYNDFLKWNPSLTSIQPCYLQPNYSYCAVDSIAAYVTIPTYGQCRYVDDGQPGTVSSCDCFTVITGSATKNPSCASIALDADIALSDLILWNPWVGSNCDDGLYKDLALDKERAVCIGVSSTNVSPITTRTTSLTSAGVTTLTRSSATPAPVQSGISMSCTAYYTAVQGDGCWAIATNHRITLEQFYAWNPSIGSDCANLWPGFAYCVAA